MTVVKKKALWYDKSIENSRSAPVVSVLPSIWQGKQRVLFLVKRS